MNTLNAILPIGFVIGALFALFLGFSKPVSMLPRWVKNTYLLLSAGMAGSGVVGYIKTFHHSSLSEHAYSVILQARAWFGGFSVGLLIVLVMAGLFPSLRGRSDRQ